MKFNKKILITIITSILLLSAIIYNFFYINSKKNEIIQEIDPKEVESEFENIEKTIFIDISGEVVNPGMYELKENSRINDAINIAGGTTEKADLTEVNLAYILTDAMKIIIPKKEIKKPIIVYKHLPVIVSTSTVQANSNNTFNNLININNASVEQLKTLTGIGDSTAQKIIQYRNEKGNFKKKEDIKNVPGIAEGKYEKIKDKITI